MNKIQNKLQQNILKIIWFRVFFSFLLILPIISLFFLERGLTMTEIFIAQWVFAAAILLWEVPSWYLADKFWKKKVLVVWTLFFTLWMLMYIFAHNFLFFAITEIILWIAFSMISWADSAMLHDSLEAQGKESEYHQVESKSYSYSMYSLAVSWIIWSVLWSYWLVFPVYLQVVVGLLMFFSVVTLYEVPQSKLNKSSTKEEIEESSISTKKVYKFLKGTSKGHFLIKLFIFTALFFTAIRLVFWYQQPFWSELWIPVMYFGFIFAALMFLRWFSSNYSVKVEEYFWEKYIFIFLIGLLLIGFWWLALFSTYIWVIVFFILFEISSWIATPLFKKYANMYTKSNMRATVLSIESMFNRIVFVLLSPLFWYFVDVLTFSQVFYITGWFFWIFLVITYVFLQKTKIWSNIF